MCISGEHSKGPIGRGDARQQGFQCFRLRLQTFAVPRSAVEVEHLIPPGRSFVHVQRARFTFESSHLLDTGFGHCRFEGVIEGQLSGVATDLLPPLGESRRMMPRPQINHADRAVSAGQGASEFFLCCGLALPSHMQGPRRGAQDGDQAPES